MKFFYEFPQNIFVFCIAGGSNSDGGFKIYSQRPDGSDQMTLNANNAKSGW